MDLVARSGGLSRAAAGAVFYSVLGAAGFVGLLTGDAVDRFGLGRVLLATLAFLSVAAFLLGAAPSFLPSVIFSAALFGAGVMLMSALLSIWSSVVFPEGPSRGFSAALFVFGVGLTAGPASLGALAAVEGAPSAVAEVAAALEGFELLGPVPARDGERLLVRAPRARSGELAAALKAVLAVRSARKAEAVRVRLDPPELG